MKKRINEILSFVRPCKVFADIGCDHGKIAIAALKSGKCGKVIASDISVKSLQKAIDGAESEGAEGIEFVVSDGFKDIKDEVDQAVVAGMGGEEIIKILSDARSMPKRLILQPMKSAEKLRRFLISSAFNVECDRLFFDGEKYYDLIVADRLVPVYRYGEEEYRWGRDNDGDNPDFVRFLTNLIETYHAAEPYVLSESAKDDLKEKLLFAEEKFKKL